MSAPHLVVIIAILSWIAFGLLAYAATLANFQRRYQSIAEENYYSDRMFALGIAMWGPVGLLATLATGSTRYGLMWRWRK